MPTVAVAHQRVRAARESHGARQRHADARARRSCRSRSSATRLEQLRAYIEGTDPITKRPFMQEVIEGLTKPLDDEDLKGADVRAFDAAAAARPTPKTICSELFMENRWTDFLPIMLPTEERVERDAQGHEPPRDKIVGRLRPTAFREFWEFDVEKVAVNAVMAGARPEYLPVILAMAASGITARSSSTTSLATISVVNGPIRNEIGMNSGIGAMGPYNHANATIGRAYGLLSQNAAGRLGAGRHLHGLARQLTGRTTPASPETEERSPWEPFHVQNGFKPTDSTVSACSSAAGTRIPGYGPRETWKEKFIRMPDRDRITTARRSS